MAENRQDAPSCPAIDSDEIGPLQIRTFLLCAIVAMADGFDTQAIAFVAPRLAQTWELPVARFGAVFSAGILGLMVGQLLFGAISDRWGRRRAVIGSTALFGFLTLATAAASNFSELIILRFITGVGLGGALPNIIALTSEFAPERHRVTLVGAIFFGFPAGAVIGGIASIALIDHFGWQAVVIAGGIVPLLLTPILILTLPESPFFLASRQAGDREEVLDEKPGPSFLALFQEGRAARTLLLWLVLALSMLVTYFLLNWLPLLITELNLPMDTAISASIALNIGGGVGGIAIARFVDRRGATRVLPVAFACGACAVALIGQVPAVAWPLCLAAMLAGFFTIGTQTSVGGVIARVYPTAIRATGLGAALTVGRIGAIGGPLIGSIMLASGRPLDLLLIWAALPLLAAALATVAIGWTLSVTEIHTQGRPPC